MAHHWQLWYLKHTTVTSPSQSLLPLNSYYKLSASVCQVNTMELWICCTSNKGDGSLSEESSRGRCVPHHPGKALYVAQSMEAVAAYCFVWYRRHRYVHLYRKGWHYFGFCCDDDNDDWLWWWCDGAILMPSPLLFWQAYCCYCCGQSQIAVFILEAKLGLFLLLISIVDCSSCWWLLQNCCWCCWCE